jgi:type VI secretion system protein ImpB
VPNIQDQIPRSRINLRYRTMIEGELKEVELPFRLIIMADLSLGSSTDRQVDLESRRLRTLDGRNLDSLMENMKMSISFQPKNVIDSSEEQLDVKLPITSRASFNPAEVAAQVPKIRALMLLRKLILEMQGQVDNRKDVRTLLQQVFANPDELKQLKDELAAYSSYHLPETKALAQPAAKAP